MPLLVWGQEKETEHFWKDVASKSENKKTNNLHTYRSLQLDTKTWKAHLATAPLEFSETATKNSLQIELPMPDGTMQLFNIVESPILAPKLAAQFPNIKTYTAQGIDDPTALARLDFTLKGFHAYIMGKDGTTIIDPLDTHQLDGNYITYHKNDRIQQGTFECHHQATETTTLSFPKSGSIGEELRTYRLAISTTGEYTAFHGGTVADAMSAIAITVNRVNLLYERDLSIRFMLVANNQLLINTDSGADPFNNNNAGQMLSNNRSFINSNIGSSNYDIGHVFATGGAGLAGFRVVCAFDKAEGATGVNPPTGDDFDIDYVAHEIGHQFGASHTFNNCGGNEVLNTAFEPGSGSTIMAYAGLCGANNVQFNSDDYFHGISLQQILNFTNNTGGSCPTKTPTGNQAPEVIVSEGGFYIPISTPFELTAEGSDPDGDDITYCWEQFDSGPISPLGNPSGKAPLFRSVEPTVEPMRLFPGLGSILNNISSIREVLPSYNRTLKFNVTVRDNKAGGGGFAWEQIAFNVTEDAGPFEVTYPNDGTEVWTTGSEVTIEWDVANTDQDPVNCEVVDITLSKNTGFTYPITLASNVPNTGSALVFLPHDAVTSFGRVKIKAGDNIFLDINDANFKIEQGLMTSTQNIGNPNAINVFPNPAKDKLTISFDENLQGETTIQLVNLDGKIVYQSKKENLRTNLEWTIENYPSGLYFLKIINNDKWYTKKIVIQK